MLTPAQLLTLKAAIAAETDAGFVVNRVAGNTGLMAEFYNTASTFIVYKTSATNDEIGDAMNGTEVAGLSSLSMQRLQLLANYSGSTQNPSRVDRRAAFDAAFSGAGGAITRVSLAALWKRAAKRGERLFATGTGTTATPGLLVFEGDIDNDDIVAALSA